jgi:ribosomal protein S18 acetylase RimI-like enzyme
VIVYVDSLAGVTAADLQGFFVGWPNPPSPETHYRILAGSQHIMLACDEETGRIVGFINAISDGVLAAYIPLLEVLPAYQGRGIGGELVRRMLARLDALYMVDLVCDEALQAFYRPLGLTPATAMMKRNYGRQTGVPFTE